MRLRNLLLGLVGALLAQGQALAITINFNNVEVPGLSNGQSVANEWAAFGVTLQDAYWYIDSRDPFDQMGVANNINGGPGTMHFVGGTDSVSVDFINIANQITISAFNSLNVLLDTFVSGGLSGTTTLNGSGIAYLQWHDGGGSVGISTVTFNAVPEPGSLALIALALAGLGALRRRP